MDQYDFDDILVNIHCCADGGSVKVSLKYLLGISDFFRKQLSNFSTKRMKETIVKTDAHNREYYVDVYYVPHLTVECSSIVLQKLLDKDTPVIYIKDNNYTDDIYDIMSYNSMYCINKPIKVTSEESNKWSIIHNHQNLPVFIKEKINHLNVFTFMKDSSVVDWVDFIVYHVGILFLLDKSKQIIIEDVLEHMNSYLCGYLTDNIAPRDAYAALVGIAGFCRDSRDNCNLVKKYISESLIIKTLKLILHGSPIDKHSNVYSCLKILIESSVIDIRSIQNNFVISE